MRSLFCVFLAVACGTVAAEELVRNGSFESESKDFAAEWKASPAFLSNGWVTLNREKAASGKNSLLLRKPSEQGVVSCSQAIVLPDKKQGSLRLDVRVKACADDADQGQLVIVTRDAEKKTLQWVRLFVFKGTFEFQEFHKTLDVHPDAVSLVVSLRAPRQGILWLDDVSVETLKSGEVRLGYEGEKSPVTGLPGPWSEKKYHGNENVSQVSFEPEKGRTCAVQKYVTGGPLSGFTAPLSQGLVRQKYIALSCPFRTGEEGTVKIGLEFFDKAGNSTGELLTGNLSSADGQDFSGNFAVPEGTVKASVLLLNTGRGEVRFGAVSAAPGSGENAFVLSEPAIRMRVLPVIHSMDQQHVSSPEFNTFTNSPTKLTFHFAGDRKRMKKPTLCIDLPVEVKIADAICPHPQNLRQEKFTVSPIERPEGKYRRWKFVFPAGMKLAKRKFMYQRRLVLLLMPETPGTVFTGKKVFYTLENNGETLQSGSFALNMLPAMPKTPNPKRFVFMRWNDEDLTWFDKEAFEASLLCMEEANYIWAARYAYPVYRASREILKKRGWKFYLHGVPNLRYYPKLNDLKIEKAVGADGKPSPKSMICPSFLTFNEEFFPIRDSIVEKHITDRSPEPGDYLMSDNEPWHPMDWCFCLRCRTIFAQRNQLDPVPEAAEIREKYSVQWRDFRLEQERRLIESICRQAKKHQLVYGDYNYAVDYSKPDYRKRFFAVSKNAMLNEANQDFHLTSYYHLPDAAGFDMMTVGTAYLKKPYIPIFAVDGAGSYLSLAEVLTPARFRMQLLNAAVTGCKGAAIYPGERLDGKFYIAADQAMKEIASLEDFFLDGKVVNDIEAKALPFREIRIRTENGERVMEWPRWKDFFRCNVRQLNGKKLLSLLNYHADRTVYVSIRLPEPGREQVLGEYIAGQKIAIPAGAKELLIAVPPQDARMIVFGDVPPPDFTPTASQEEVRAAFEREKSQFNAGAALPEAWKDKDFEFSYSDMDSDGAPEVVIRNRKLALTIEPKNGRIAGAELSGVSLFGKERFAGFMAEPRLWIPVQLRRSMTFKNTDFVSAKRQDGKLTAEQLMTGNPLDLEIRRTYTLTADGNTLEIRTTCRNTGKVTLTLIPWTRSAFTVSEKSGSTDISGNIGGTEQKLPLVSGCTQAILSGKEKDPAASSRTGKTVLTLDSPVVDQFFPSLGIRVRYRPDPAQAASFYFDSSVNTTTTEWFHSEFSLAPGESKSVVDVYEFGVMKK